jgi:transcriptional regulator with XRE-family HTH domain
VSVVLHAARLRHELARRGLSAIDLARDSGLSPATVSAALAGRAISATSLQLIGETLTRTPVIEVIDSLILTGNDADALHTLDAQ